MGCLLSSSVVGLMVTSSKRAYATPRTAAPRAPAPVAGHCWPGPPQETLKHSKAGLAQCMWSLLVSSRFCSRHLSVWQVWVLILNVISPLLLSFQGILLCLGQGAIFFWWDPMFFCWWLFSSKFDFGVLAEDESMSFYAAILGQFGKLSSDHRTGKGQFSFQSQTKTMPKNVQTMTQLHSSHMVAK